MEKISIIVPVYNSEMYLEKCLTSMINQTYPNIEILLINDGSKDNSAEICKEYEAKYDCVKFFNLLENRGVSYARNLGLEKATGVLIGFVDSDDWIEPDMFSHLYKTMLECDVPVVGATFRYIHPGKKIMNIPAQSKIDYIFLNNVIDALLYNTARRDGVLWNKLYRKEVFNGITFPVGKVYEDIGTLHLIIENAESMVVSSKCVYNYYLQPTSITRRYMDSTIFQHLYMAIERYEYLSKKYDSKELENVCRQQIFETLFHVVDNIDHVRISENELMREEYSNVREQVFDGYSYEDCGFGSNGIQLANALKKGIMQYKITRDMQKL